MKLHSNLLNGIVEILEISFSGNLYADKVIEKSLRSNKKWGSRDRSFVAQHAYEIIRWWRLIWFLKGEDPSLKKDKLFELFEVYWKWAIEKTISTPNDLPIAVIESYPIWLDKKAAMELGENWPILARALNIQANVVLRTNTLKISREQLLLRLAQEDIEAKSSKITSEAITLINRRKLKDLQSFKSGLFEIQDGGSQLISNFLAPMPGDKIMDCCSGAGGKALSLASKMKNIGEVLCIDIELSKIKELEIRAERAGATCIRTHLLLEAEELKEYSGWADKMLLDVPCSGTGVIRRDVDVKWKLTPEHLEGTLELQQEILNNYSKLLKVGGLLVYATCSILESENEMQIIKFLESHSESYELEHQERLSPLNIDSDGYYVALLRKKL